MNDKEYTKFRLNLSGFTIELAGERSFVEELYQKVYRDLLPLIQDAALPPVEVSTSKRQPPPVSPTRGAKAPPKGKILSPGMGDKPPGNYTWVYNCTPHYNKVYVVENNSILHTSFGRFLDARCLRRVYLDRQSKSKLFESLSSGNRTLWAEITPEGRRLIEAAAKQRKPVVLPEKPK